MNARKGMLWYTVSGASELSWMLAWAMLYSLALIHRPFPVFETVASFALAVAVTRLWADQGWRMVGVLGVELLAFACAATLMIHASDFSSMPLFDRGWIDTLFNGSKSVMEWLLLSVDLILIALIWIGGVTLALRPREYYRACGRFDIGLAAFFLLFLVKLIALTKGEAMAWDSVTLLFVYPFFLFGLLSIGMSRVQDTGSRSFLPGRRRLGVVVSFVTVVLLGTGGMVLFFLPALTAAAQMGYRTLAFVGKPIVPLVISVLRFLFGARNSRAELDSRPAPQADWGEAAPLAQSWWTDLMEKIIGWGLWGLMLLMLFLAVAIALFWIAKWLLSRTRQSTRQQAPTIAPRFTALWSLLIGIWRRIRSGWRDRRKAVELYGALLGWADRSGLPRCDTETPLEFGTRLTSRFPPLRPPIECIIGAYNREIYGEADLSGTPLAEANAAWRAMRNPLRWPMRLKGWFADAS